MKLYTFEIVDFNSKDCNEGLRFHKETFLNVINSPQFKNKVKRRTLIGGVSHRCRDEYLRYMDEHYCSVGNHADFLIDKGLACNVLVDIWNEGSKVYAKLMTLPTEKGAEFDRLFAAGIDIKVSMSVEVDQDKEYYYLSDILGVDFTVGPAFDTKCIKMEELDAKSK